MIGVIHMHQKGPRTDEERTGAFLFKTSPEENESRLDRPLELTVQHQMGEVFSHRAFSFLKAVAKANPANGFEPQPFCIQPCLPFS
ncbi:hypothetical protein CEXT_156721 [Caerostris extrusa]|uniref:Uncharacterized protein n=1 Tax=Caerostris extrusa TaxID=172846 RepID=A0AAV4UWJ2_CAEEX|nr:hypothetical protein CEXT_156721 [Caerostris extrusa]